MDLLFLTVVIIFFINILLTLYTHFTIRSIPGQDREITYILERTITNDYT